MRVACQVHTSLSKKLNQIKSKKMERLPNIQVVLALSMET